MAMAAQPVAPGGRYREVAAVRGDEALGAAVPFPVTVVPADLVR